ncbi:MAG: hypothetical protein DRI61_05450 [Chloroflexi bacterium]|nr:MAG: hypothetical protein DRI61_05450 [Chloroflexota bacterium]
MGWCGPGLPGHPPHSIGAEVKMVSVLRQRLRLCPKICIALMAGVPAFVVYAITGAPTVLYGDGGEFQFVPYILGIPHPTGYPLYCLLGWVWSHLVPIGDVARRMNLFSALWGGMAVGMVVLLAMRALKPPGSLSRGAGDITPFILALMAALALAFSPTFWSQALIAEVYTFHAFLTAALLWAVVAGKRIELVALILGLGLAHHRSILLLTPGVVAFYILRRERPKGSLRLALVALVLPLSLYAYIPLRAPHLPYLRVPLSPDDTLVLHPNTLQGFINFVLGKRFGGLLDWRAIGPERAYMVGKLLIEQFGWGGVTLGLVGLVALSTRRRWDVLALTGLGYISIALFNMAYLIGDIHVLFIPSYIIFALWMAAGGQELICLGRRLHPKATYVSAVFLALPLWLLLTNFHVLDRSQDFTAREQWVRILSLPFPEGAVLVSNDRNELVPLYYYQLVGGRRPDLIALYPLITPEMQDVGLVLDRALASGRPVFTIKPMRGLEVAYRWVEWEGLGKVEGTYEGANFEPVEVAIAEPLMLAGYELCEPKEEGELCIALYWRVREPIGEVLHSYVHLLDEQGERVAGSDHRPGGDFYPTSLWKPGQLLRDVHRIKGLKELAPLPGQSPGALTFKLRAGMYRWPSIEPYGHTVEFTVVKRGDQASAY